MGVTKQLVLVVSLSLAFGETSRRMFASTGLRAPALARARHSPPALPQRVPSRQASAFQHGHVPRTAKLDVRGRAERFDTRATEPFELLNDQNSVKVLSEFRKFCFFSFFKQQTRFRKIR